KIIVYVLMMKRGFSVTHFFDYLMRIGWFRESVDLFFNSEYQKMYDTVLGDFLDKGIVVMDKEQYKTTVQP
ncbi:MAG: hypothetical protein JRL30_19965, partial [Deltaproteobacteria bacterium]|nr:hypothetical protein [Deltaproteobacteria bacterium]